MCSSLFDSHPKRLQIAWLVVADRKIGWLWHIMLLHDGTIGRTDGAQNRRHEFCGQPGGGVACGKQNSARFKQRKRSKHQFAVIFMSLKYSMRLGAGKGRRIQQDNLEAASLSC